MAFACFLFFVFTQISWVCRCVDFRSLSGDLKIASSVFICLRLSPDERSSVPFQPTTAWKHHMNEMHYALSDPSNTNRRIQMLPPSVWWSRKCEAIASSILHQAGCCVSFHLLPAKICDVPPSITADSHLAGCFCSSCATVCPRKKKKKDVWGSSTRVNNYEPCLVCLSLPLPSEDSERAFHFTSRHMLFIRGSEVEAVRWSLPEQVQTLRCYKETVQSYFGG